ncbi:16S rRNA (cytosine(967)-C(5))-methyltransferase RsmB [Porticoccus sp. W117]|uniref:16S rRNA (cytosine(967)-C(5))-methyltransferase RsmB n=1 Tax=Porticoccus sp. W117 TaxID=3054777 RepID=UPI0025960445|nr:16S rRNA (cytosine(967)-C(5))-methyltransferase RsmB [Porticoccus sp. W117]MDM3870454.1 16S rRNA (cytosine(967)-C(5))-methyltransferase RsmB [Porticoccus sp. W117]
MDVRVAAAKAIAATLREQGSLATLLPECQSKVKARDRALLQELCFGTLRYYPRLALILEKLLAKPFKPKDNDLQALLACALYQLMETRIPPHAAIGESVQAAVALKKQWAKGLVNGVLRRFDREKDAICDEFSTSRQFQSCHPQWLIDALDAAWPADSDTIMAGNNQRPPMTLRVNRQKHSRENYAKILEKEGFGFQMSAISADALVLDQPADVAELPHFAEGGVSVQDEAAQLAAQLLSVQPNQRVLDACCAPGGKTCHLLELEPSLDVVALDIDEQRLSRVQQNLDRLQLAAELVTADACAVEQWWDGRQFDRILLDAPCSATGVIRRHPDIKVLRRPADIAKLAALQLQLLQALWPLLRDGGKLLYATCSILPEENNALVERALQELPGAQVVALDGGGHADWGCTTATGRQLFPQPQGHDGFYYALMQKQN